jgi:toxin CptA
MMLRLRKGSGKRYQHLWLAADSMDEGEWRDLRRMLSQQPTHGR